MEIPYGYCQCGCGRQTTIATQNRMRDGSKKGEPKRFIWGHQRRIPGKKLFHSHGYEIIRILDHPRSNNGVVLAHIVIVEKVLGKPLPEKSEVHHFPLKENFTHLVLCQDSGYHKLLHTRYRALIACSNPNWRKCIYCKKYDSQDNLYTGPHGNHGYRHRVCFTTYQRNYHGRSGKSSRPPLNIIKKNSERL